MGQKNIIGLKIILFHSLLHQIRTHTDECVYTSYPITKSMSSTGACWIMRISTASTRSSCLNSFMPESLYMESIMFFIPSSKELKSNGAMILPYAYGMWMSLLVSACDRVENSLI
nr:betaV1 protein [Sida leaf curl virus-associated DNA beta]